MPYSCGGRKDVPADEVYLFTGEMNVVSQIQVRTATY